MLKRINQRFATKSALNMETLNEVGYMPTAEEIEHPDLNWSELKDLQEKYRFEGDYKCTLCPKKIL